MHPPLSGLPTSVRHHHLPYSSPISSSNNERGNLIGSANIHLSVWAEPPAPTRTCLRQIIWCLLRQLPTQAHSTRLEEQGRVKWCKRNGKSWSFGPDPLQSCFSQKQLGVQRQWHSRIFYRDKTLHFCTTRLKFSPVQWISTFWKVIFQFSPGYIIPHLINPECSFPPYPLQIRFR